MSILGKFSKNFDFGQNLRKIPNFSKISKTMDLSQIIEKVRFCQNFDFFPKFRKIRFWSNFPKISILVNFDFGQIFDFGQNIRKILIFFENFEIFRLGLNFWIISIWVKFSKKIFPKFFIYSKISKYFDFGEIFEKFRFWSNFRKISILVKFRNSSTFFRKFR